MFAQHTQTGQGYQTVLLTKITDSLKFIKDESILLQVIAVNTFPKRTKKPNILEHLLTIKIRLQFKITFLIKFSYHFSKPNAETKHYFSLVWKNKDKMTKFQAITTI